MNKKEVSASLAGTVSLGGEVSVNRLGFGTMRLTGEGIWGPPRDRKKALGVLQAEIARFNERAAAGEFARPPNHPRKSTVLARI